MMNWYFDAHRDEVEMIKPIIIDCMQISPAPAQ